MAEFKDFDLPRGEYAYEFVSVDPFYLPEFKALHETEAEWRNRVRERFEKFLDAHASNFRGMFQSYIDGGKVVKVRPFRGTTPLELRYEWAAKRYCLNTPYRQLANKGYSEDRIKQAVLKIFKEAELKGK